MTFLRWYANTTLGRNTSAKLALEDVWNALSNAGHSPQSIAGLLDEVVRCMKERKP